MMSRSSRPAPASTLPAATPAPGRRVARLLLALNTPTIFNAALSFRLNWEGNFRSLELEAENALRNPRLMASSADEVVSKLQADPETVRRFRDAYGHGPNVTALLGACLSIRRISLYTEGRVRFCLAHEQDLSPLENR